MAGEFLKVNEMHCKHQENASTVGNLYVHVSVLATMEGKGCSGVERDPMLRAG